ncbi:hypothetical protein FA13DRAFT_97319 [Coprinellus micaceus]|uniref:Uncharacterized protein n=1 Tax=Coprinellus micaceus TaxID=71717 RepID=A0A4Y7SIQ5_COPMI|nr:hypothetical protein FA13DRAFT_97319 [Coprinellus micaceus]
MVAPLDLGAYSGCDKIRFHEPIKVRHCGCPPFDLDLLLDHHTSNLGPFTIFLHGLSSLCGVLPCFGIDAFVTLVPGIKSCPGAFSGGGKAERRVEGEERRGEHTFTDPCVTEVRTSIQGCSSAEDRNPQTRGQSQVDADASNTIPIPMSRPRSSHPPGRNVERIQNRTLSSKSRGGKA